MRICEYIFEVLKKFGCDTLFGVPGSLIDPVWQTAFTYGLNVVTCTHEGDAAYIANAYAKGSHKLVAVMTTGCPGVTNALSGIASAERDSTPLIYISGVAPLQSWGMGTRQEESLIDRAFISTDVSVNLTKKSILLSDPTGAGKDFIMCCKIATMKRQGVVHVSMPLDVQTAIATKNDLLCLSRLKQSLKKEKFLPIYQDAYFKINKATKPLIIIGWGAYLENCVSEIYDFANKIKAPVLVTSKGVTCERYNELVFLGNLGFGKTAIIQNFLCEYSPNCTILFGSSLSARDFTAPLKDIISKCNDIFLFTCEGSNINMRMPNCKILKTMRMKEEVATLIQYVNLRDENSILDKISSVKKAQQEYYRSLITVHDNMARYISFINDIAKDDVCVTADAGNNLLNAGILYHPLHEGCFYLDFGIRAMGNGICTSIGLAFSNLCNNYICIAGDGGILMNGNSLYLAAKYNLHILFIIFNNKSLGRIRIAYQDKGNYFGTDLGDIDFCMYGKAFGILSHKVRDIQDFILFFNYYKKLSGPVLLEIETSPDEVPVVLKSSGIKLRESKEKLSKKDDG